METDIAIPDNKVNGITVALDASDALDIEHVGLSLLITGGFMGGYVIELTSPDGAVSAQSTPFNDGDPATEGWFPSSNAFRGEAGPGTGTLCIRDVWEALQGTLRSATRTFIGNAPGEDDLYVYTDAFSEIYDGSGHVARIDDGAGGNDTLNATAVSSASSINLRDGSAMIDGVVFDSIAGIERVFTGDGDNLIDGGIGADVLNGVAGNDMITALEGFDTITDFGSVDRIARDAVAPGIVGLTASQVITRFRSSDGTDSMFDFGDGIILIVEDRPAGAVFWDRIDII